MARGGDCAPPARDCLKADPAESRPRARRRRARAGRARAGERLRAGCGRKRLASGALRQAPGTAGGAAAHRGAERVRVPFRRGASMGSPWNSSDGAEGALPPCDERLCSPFPLGALVPVTAVCLGLFAVGVSGNVVTVLLIGRYRDMRTTTNLYLGSMAVSDLLILLGLPFDLYRLWRSRPWVFGQLLCRLSLYLGEGCTYATLLHMTALSVERYLAICRPLRARVLVTRRRVRSLIAALWAVALLSAGPFFFLVGVEQDPGLDAVLDLNGSAPLTPSPRTSPPPSPPGPSRAPPLSPPSGPEAAAAAALFSRECRPSPAQLGALRVMLWVTTAYFFLPFLCLSVLYGLIGRELWRSREPLRGPATSGREKGHRQTVRVLRKWPHLFQTHQPRGPGCMTFPGSPSASASYTALCHATLASTCRCFPAPEKTVASPPRALGNPRAPLRAGCLGQLSQNERSVSWADQHG